MQAATIASRAERQKSEQTLHLTWHQGIYTLVSATSQQALQENNTIKEEVCLLTLCSSSGRLAEQ